MKNKIIIPSILVLIALSFLGVITHAEKPFAPNVDSKTGAISVPKDYTRWATLGTWAHANTELKRTMDHPEVPPQASCSLGRNQC